MDRQGIRIALISLRALLHVCTTPLCGQYEYSRAGYGISVLVDSTTNATTDERLHRFLRRIESLVREHEAGPALAMVSLKLAEYRKDEQA